MNEVRAIAPAKVNLSLRILGRRPDGYHDLDTIFQAVDLCDVVHVRRGGAGIQFVVEGNDSGPSEENLVVRAARAFLVQADLVGEGLHMRLEKRIPVGAGLGGGSSDAAATLLALDQLFAGAMDPGRISGLAAELGSDVPFFLGTSTLATGRGRGELIEARKPLPSLPGVVVFPTVQVSTRDAYGELARAREAGESDRLAAQGAMVPPIDWDQIAAGATNDFEVVVCRTHPPVAEALAALRATEPLVALMSGSGSASFAFYQDEGGAEQATSVLSRHGGLRVFGMRTLTAWPDRT